jgi:hypothetical protein
MILRRQRFRIIHTAERHVDGAGQVGALIGQSGSTFAAETANDVRRRCIGSWLAFDKRELIGVKSGPGDKGRAARAPASPAMAVCDTVRFPRCTITNRTTKTASFNRFHDERLLILTSSWLVDIRQPKAESWFFARDRSVIDTGLES